QRDQTLVRRQAVLIVGRKYRDQFRLECDTRNVTGHQSEQSTVAEPHGCARRHRSRSGGVDDERIGERFEHRVDIQKALHIRAAQVQELAHRRDHIHLMAQFLRNGKLLTLMLGHFAVDSYVGVIPVLYPVLIGRFHLSLATVGLVSLAYGGMAAISQPIFGLLADRFGTRLTGLALAWTAITFAVVGFVDSFPLLLALALASGLGSGASRLLLPSSPWCFVPVPVLWCPAHLPRAPPGALGRVACRSLAARSGRCAVLPPPLLLTVPPSLLFSTSTRRAAPTTPSQPP